MKKIKVALVGGRKSGHAGVVLDILLSMNSIQVVCIFDNTPALHGSKIRGVEIVGSFDDKFKDWASKIDSVHIAIGDNYSRESIALNLKLYKIQLISVIHPDSLVSSSALIGDGCFLGPRAVIQSNAVIGIGTIINTGVIVEHDCKIGNFVHLAPATVLAGRVSVGSLSFLGIGTLVKPDINIGKYTYSGAGSVITKDVEEKTIVLGHPAKPALASFYDRVVKGILK